MTAFQRRPAVWRYWLGALAALALVVVCSGQGQSLSGEASLARPAPQQTAVENPGQAGRSMPGNTVGQDDPGDASTLEVIDQLTQEIRSDPRNATIYYKRGVAFAARGLNELALLDLSQAIVLRSDYQEALLERARVYRKLGKSEQAIRDAQEAIRCNSAEAAAYGLLGLVYLDRKEYRKAICYLEEARHRGLQQVDNQLAAAYFGLGVTQTVSRHSASVASTGADVGGN